MSLRSIILKGRWFINDHWLDLWVAGGREEFNDLAKHTMLALSSRDTILVKAQSVLEDLLPSRHPDPMEVYKRALNFIDIPRPKPPFERMWLEGIVRPNERVGDAWPPQRVGVLVKRIEIPKGALDDDSWLDRHEMEHYPGVRNVIKEDDPATLVKAAVFHENEGSAAFTGGVAYWLDAKGNFQRSFREVPHLYKENEPEKRQRQIYNLKLREGWMLHTFARMNCANVELRKIADGGHRHKDKRRKRGLPPHSEWHEIVIGAAPGIRNEEPRQGIGEQSAVRFHWVRGHYADYRAGKGLFGKYRDLYWIPEHRRGNEEQGEIVPEYSIEAGQQR